MTLNWNRLLSGLIAASYIIGGFLVRGGEGAIKILALVLMPLACIWFSDAMGGYTGLSGSTAINAPSPGIIVCILGWLLLLLPLFFLIVAYVET
jgi:hypothetical protein